jgi:Ferritin-like
MFKSRMWGIGWNPSTTLPQETKRHISRARTSRTLAEKACKVGLPSIPGRTARLKAIYLLQIAAEIEHALMVQYLYAAYAIDERFAEGRDDELLATIMRWKRDIRAVARQEMAHLITVQNLLIALGADADLNRENNFLLHPDEYPFPVCFEPLSLRSLAKYVATESPELEEVSGVRDRKALLRVLTKVKAESKTKINRVGVIYMTLYWLFLKSDKSAGPCKELSSIAPCMERAGLRGMHLQDQDFVTLREFADFEATPSEWHVFESGMKVSETDARSRALSAIHWIMAQGEGPVGAKVPEKQAGNASHFKKFLTIFEEFSKHSSRLSRAIQCVPVNPNSSDHRRGDTPRGSRNFITEPQAKMWAQLFNLRYQMLLIDILLALSTNRRTCENHRQTLIDWAVLNEMGFLRLIGEKLPTMPRHPGSHVYAGAPFETIEMPADAAKRWDLHRVLMLRAKNLMARLRKIVADETDAHNLLQKMTEFDASRLSLVIEKSTVPRKFHWRAGKVSHDTRKRGSLNG